MISPLNWAVWIANIHPVLTHKDSCVIWFCLILWSWPLSVPSIPVYVAFIQYPSHKCYCADTLCDRVFVYMFLYQSPLQYGPCLLLPRRLLADSSVSPNDQECRLLGISIEFKFSRSIIIDMPKLMKGLEKSMTSSRTKVIVRGAIAISAFYKRKDTWKHVG